MKVKLFLDNDTSISIRHDHATIDLDMNLNCNSFELDNVETYDRYGIFVHQGADMDDIGGDGQTIDPAGNGWPVDPSSTGYPNSTTGNSNNVDVDLWDPPTNWYSIYDVNTSPGWTYWRYNNEFVGEGSSVVSVSPSSIVENAGPNPPQANAPSNHCIASLNIPFPQQGVVLGHNDKTMSKSIKIYPVPTDKILNIDLASDFKINSIDLFDLMGREIEVKFERKKYGFLVDLQNISPNYYVLIIMRDNGEVERRAVIVNK